MSSKFPDWLKKRFPSGGETRQVKKLLKELDLNTVCQSAHCPNQCECFGSNTATFMILGKVCTRHCRFCNISSGEPEEVNPEEPKNIAEAVSRLGLKYVVITSVTRDDLEDGGVNQFIKCVREIKKLSPEINIELLTPDFKGNKKLLQGLAAANFEVFNHNLETVPRLYERVRPEADYRRSLEVLDRMKSLDPDKYTKSGLMVGLGETKEEVTAVIRDLKESGCDMLTIGQYLQPSKEHLEVEEFIKPEQFEEYKRIGEDRGVKVIAGPFVRSSYQAAESFAEIK